MSPVVLDTDASSLILKERLPSNLEAKLAGADLVLTFVTRAELVKWTYVGGWGFRNRRELHRWMRKLYIVVGDEDVADTYGMLSFSANRRGRPRPMNDMWIAACCLTARLPLVTLNVKDFEDFATHHGLELITA